MLVKDMTPELFGSIKDYVTVYGDGKVNINTATGRVMLAAGLSDQAVGAIMALRNGPDLIAGTKDDLIFSGDIAMQIEAFNLNISNDDKARLTENNFTSKSNYFRIDSKGMVDRSRITSRLVCVLQRGAKQLEYYREY